jgi:hypothetical protein
MNPPILPHDFKCRHCYDTGIDCNTYGQFPCSCSAGNNIPDDHPDLGGYKPAAQHDEELAIAKREAVAQGQHAVEMTEYAQKLEAEVKRWKQAAIDADDARELLEQDRTRLAFVLKHGLPSCAFGDEWHYGQYGDGDTYATPEAAINAEMQKGTQ